MIYPLLLRRSRYSLHRALWVRVRWDLLQAAEFRRGNAVWALCQPGAIILCRVEDGGIWESVVGTGAAKFALRVQPTSIRRKRGQGMALRWDLLNAARLESGSYAWALTGPGAVVICAWETLTAWEALVDEFSLRVAVRAELPKFMELSEPTAVEQERSV